MSIHDRLSMIRSNLGLTTRSFGEGISLSGGIITNMEKGRRNVTERTIKDICREYGVNQGWLTTGEGVMFDDALADLEISQDVRELSTSYSRLSDSDKVLVKNLIDSLAEKSILPSE